MTAAAKEGEPDQEYGRLTLGSFMYARGDELLHWQDAVSQPRITVTRWHILNGTPSRAPE